jgi:asparagine synthase (glutamine-hydrolysing)
MRAELTAELAPTLELGSARWREGFQDWQGALHGLGPEVCAARAQGDFAVGLRMQNGSAFLAVDRFAIQTLCYRIVDGRLQFAARADQLGAKQIDPQAIFDYLYFHAIPSPRTVFAGVHRLPPGHFALFENGELTVRPYWIPAFDEAPPESFDALRAEFRSLLRDAVRRHLGNGLPACFLSGGTDSSTIAGVLAELTDRGAHSFSIGFDASGYDEMAFARIAARHFGTQHHEYYLRPEDLVECISHVAASYDQPFGNSSALPAYYCALRAKEEGVTTLLAGDGGDELFGGNSRYATQRIFNWYGTLPRGLRSAMLEPFFELDWVGRTTVLKKGSGYIRHAKTPMPDRLQTFNLLRRLGMDIILTPQFLATVEPDSVLRQQRDVWAQARGASELDRMLAFDWRYTLAESDLPKVRGTTQLAGIGVAFPLLDDALVEFSMRLPASYKLRGPKLRWFFKEALRGFLPDEIITKKKQGFGLPFGVWVTQHAGLMALAKDSLDGIGARGVVRRDFLKALVEKHLPEHPGYYGEMVWILMMLEQWLRAHSPAFELDR